MTGEQGNKYGGNGGGIDESGSFALSVWVAVAGVAVLFAIVALVYGAPTRTAASQPRPSSYSGGATLLSSTPVNRDLESDMTSSNGRSDMVAVPGRLPETGVELARVKTENVALRQVADQLRGQVDALSERLGRMENRFSEMTGSIGTPSSIAPVAPKIAAAQPPIDLSSIGPSDSRSGTEAPRTQFGMELGTYADLTTLKVGWSDLVRQHPALFEGLDGLATIRDRGGRTELLLIAGPFRNAADAAEHCGKVEAVGLRCLPAFYLGQQLSTQ